MFQLPDEANIFIIEGEYSIPIVLLSIVIAFGASYTALFINKQIKNNGFFHCNIWIFLASLAMGLGIWSMHFIGMTAFKLPIEMEHNTWLTILSAFPAIFSSFLAFYFANTKKQSIRTLIIASLFMGAGISTMHYLGMAAMEIEVQYVYNVVPFFISIVIAILASFAALMLFSSGSKYTDKLIIKLAAAFVMAIAISSMHYTGMVAMQFYSLTELEYYTSHNHTADFTPTILLIAISIFLLFIITYLTSRLDTYVNFRLKNFDALTSMPNHNQFMEDQKQFPESSFVAIIHIHNLERFISAYGYTFGDDILLQVQQIITKILPDEGRVYRTEANRFTVVAPLEMDHQIIRISLDQICSILSKQLFVQERFINVEMAVAISSTEKKEKVQVLFANAIAVLQSSQIKFTHQLINYNPQKHTFNFERQITIDLDQAMEENQLYIVYQPKVNPVQNTVAGLEALIRWQHPEYGFISPGKFIPIFESTNKITDLTDWIIKKVCQQMEEWNAAELPFQQVSINVPGSYITSPNLVNVLNECLISHRISAQQIELEITETSFIHDIHNAIQAVRSFREKGFNVALDDFGTGLSSLSYLKEIPITTIKIDKSFVDGVPTSKKDGAILKAILSLCNSLDLHVVIEGVETKEQVDYLLGTPINPLIQGYYYSKPLPAHELVTWCKNIEYQTV